MIHEVRINFNVITEAGSGPPQEDNIAFSDAYNTLSSIIAGLNDHSGDYCVVVQVINANSLADSNLYTRRLESLTGQLTKREREIFHLALSGLSNRLISEKLFITMETVKSHRKNIVGKAGATSMEEIKTWLLKTKF